MKLMVLDGNSIINRAFFGIKVLNTRDGFPTNALFGMMTMIDRQIQQISPEYAAVAFDVHAPTFRHLLYADYKAGRHPTPEDLLKQMPVAKQMVVAMGLHVLELEGYEADDILGTVSRLAEAENAEAYVMTGDRDSLQLISDKTHVLLAKTGTTVDYSRETFCSEYGVSPEQFIEVKGLMGDSSDNYPGVRGIGEKTAFGLIAKYKSIDGVYENLSSGDFTASVRAKLEAGKESAYLSKKLAAIERFVPLSVGLQDLVYHGYTASFVDFCRKYEFGAMLEKLKNVCISGDVCETAQSTVPVKSCDRDALLSMEDIPISVTYEENVISVSDGSVCYVCDGFDAGNMAAFLSSHKQMIVLDSKAFYHRLLRDAIPFPQVWFDVTLAAYIVNSNLGKYDLNDLVTSFLHQSLNEKTPVTFYLMELYKILSKELEDTCQTSVLQSIELPLALVLANMENCGFTIDADGIRQYGKTLRERAAALENEIYGYAGTTFNINSPKQLGDVLFEKLQLPSGKKTKNGYSTNAEILEKIKYYHPIVPKILEYRQLTKLVGTYVDGLLKVADEQGIIHTTFNQTGTATGRLSSSEPNLQNIPIRTELGRELRRFFIPADDSHVLIDADYSQIELRLLAHIAHDPTMSAAFIEGQDIHASTAATVFHLSKEEVTPEIRKRAKAINFGILYGMGDYSLADDLGIPRIQAKEYINQYLATYPLIDDYLNAVIEDAHRSGFVTTMMGRRRYIPEINNSNKNIQHFGERVAMNSPIQGTAADIIKIAMIRVHRRLIEEGIDSHLILQIHDELILESHKDCADAALRILCEEMENAVQLSVPLIVDAHVGSDWFSAK